MTGIQGYDSICGQEERKLKSLNLELKSLYNIVNTRTECYKQELVGMREKVFSVLADASI